MIQQKNAVSKHRNDLLFILALVLAMSLLGGAFFLLRGEGNTVTVTVNGAPYGSYSLDESRTVEIRTGGEDEQINRLVIADGQAKVEFASCPDGICAAHKPISREGESIVCLPHRVVITVRTVEDEGGPDIVA